MHNFEWNLPTKIIYGAGEFSHVGKIAKEYGKHVFLVTYQPQPALDWMVEKTARLLQEEGLEVTVYNKVEPNPRVTTVDEGARQFKEVGADVAVALGGGSVIDAAKYISSVAYSGGSSWDYVVLGYRPAKEYTGAYPIIAIPTVSASGSEANAGGVITNWETNEKSFSRSPYRIPKAAIIDPELLASLPRHITADSGVDIFSHLIEHYLSSSAESEIADRITEGLILTLMENLDRALKDGNDLEARGQIALCALFGWSGLQALGRLGSIPIHYFEHQVSGHYDISHGRGMTILIPPYLEYFADAKPERWAKLARRVFGVVEEDDVNAAKALSGAVIEWLKGIDMHLKFSDVKIGDEKFEQMTDETFRMYAGEDGTIPGARPMTKDDMLAVLNMSL